MDGRRVPLLPLRTREPLRARAVHRLSGRRRLRGACGRRRALLLSDPRGLPGSAGCPAAVRWADRISVAAYQGRRVFAFTRAGDAETQRFALQLGAEWAGDSEGGSEVSQPADAGPPEPLDAAIIFAPVGALVPVALRAVAPGGTVVCAGIHMSDIPSFPYE